MHRRRRPEIFNSDQGGQFTSEAFVGALEQAQIKISMDGRGRAYDNIFIERLWRTVKYENLYPQEYETMAEATMGLRNYFEFYNQERLHQSLDYQAPAPSAASVAVRVLSPPPSLADAAMPSYAICRKMEFPDIADPSAP